jgi:hypothetical protein
MLQYIFKPEQTSTDKGSMKACSSHIQMEISMSIRVVNLGLPPGRALFKDESRTYLRVLTLAFCLLRILHCRRGNSPFLFFLFF